MAIDEPLLPEFTPIIIVFAVLVLAFLAAQVLELDVGNWTLLMFFFGVLAISIYAWGYEEPLLLVAGIFSIGISGYAQFGRD
jgi:hypothetical protein